MPKRIFPETRKTELLVHILCSTNVTSNSTRRGVCDASLHMGGSPLLVCTTTITDGDEDHTGNVSTHKERTRMGDMVQDEAVMEKSW